jgi:hypothetical protein
METASQFITPAIILLMTLAFGFWLSHEGKPYQGLLFNGHKLIALAGVVLAGIQFNKILHTFDGLLITLLVLMVLCVIALFTSGALMSAGKLDYAPMLAVHRAAPVVLVIGWGLSLFLLKSSP